MSFLIFTYMKYNMQLVHSEMRCKFNQKIKFISF